MRMPALITCDVHRGDGDYCSAVSFAAVTESLTSSGLLQELVEAVQTPPFSIRSLGIRTEEFWHFMFKMSSRNQLTYPEFEGAYAEGSPGRRRLFRDYQHLHTKVMASEQAEPTPAGKARAMFVVTEQHSIFVYLTSEFEFCACSSPLVRKEHAMEVAIFLVNEWMYREREKLFLLDPNFW